jgi:hypothetical protein
MPKVGKTRYPYTVKGIQKARKAAKRAAKPTRRTGKTKR